MTKFSYKARSQSGNLTTGYMDADSKNDVANFLMQDQMIPISIEKDTVDNKKDKKTDGIVWPWQKISQMQIVMFSKQMYTLTKAGVPLTTAVQELIDSINYAPLKEALIDVHTQLDSGRELSVAFSRHPRVFSPMFITMVRVGETTGRLDQAFFELSKYLTFEEVTVKRLKKATRYPIMLIMSMVIAIIIISMFVVPVFSDFFSRFNADLPWLTVAFISFSDFMREHWLILLLTFTIAFIGFHLLLANEKGRLWWDKTKLSIPLLGKIYKLDSLGRFARSFAMASRAGVPLMQTIEVVVKVLNNAFYVKKMDKLINYVQHGQALSIAAEKTEIFTPMVLQMIRVGEETGNIDGLLMEIADHYEREVIFEVEKLGDAIEPIMISMLALFVLLLALAIFVPMWEIGNVFLQK